MDLFSEAKTHSLEIIIGPRRATGAWGGDFLSEESPKSNGEFLNAGLHGAGNTNNHNKQQKIFYYCLARLIHEKSP